ncbi:hypothetical protein CTAYLR_005927 [Chrysophaeum taylorii]|uniref:PKD/REJ-like domain-containing protein n=1 Tax=Chrysophaeum taylorii TaxID=2483200 RepID=A0AAD7UAY3_9STRA|nr:hypothetical protein CTAYLR_005927 [Chrysophaeum taylorii]
MLVLASIAFGVAAQNLSATLAPTSATCGPLLEKAQFEASGGSVLVEYTSATDQGGSPAGTKFGCDTLLDFAGASSALCYWIDARRVSAAVSESVELVPGKNITQRAGLLCPAESEPCNDCLAPASTTVVLASEAPAELSVVLQAPATVAAGQGLNVSARQSTGLGGRDPQAYEWSVDNQTVETTTWYELSLNSSDLEQWSSTTVRASLRVKNFLGVEATEWIDIELSETRELPYVYVRGPRRRKVSRWREIELNARGAATSCTNRSQIERGIDYEFHFFRVVGDSLEATPELENTARDPRAFILPAYSLEVNETYSLVATAIDRNLTISNSATATLFVEPSDSVVAVIEGGNRTVARSAEPTVTLSGASSFDPDVEDLLGAEAGLVFDWSCEAPPNVAAPRSVVGCAASLESDGAYLTLDPLSFNATTYTFVLRVTDSNNAREATATATLDFVDAEVASPVLSLEPRTSSALAGQRVSVRGVVTDNGGGASKINASWSIDDDSELKNDVSFREAALTALEVTSSSFGGTTNRTVSLVLAPNTLVPRATYRFRLSAISVEAVDDASRYHSEATVDVVVAAPPDAGRLDVSPNVGFAVTTEFELEARAFATSEPPLRFRFETRDGGSLLKVLQTATPEPRSPAFLAEADPAELACVAVDALGATAEASANATVLPYAGGAIEVDASNSIQVAETFYDKDAVCQQAIATATASDGAEVRNLLVAALIEIWEVYDFFNDQLAAYASALRAPMDTPEDLSVDISASSLQQARDVIFRLSTLGVDSELDDLSATDLSFVFSNILNTALFTNASEYDNLEDTVVTDRLDVDSNYEPKNATAILSEAVDLIAAARLRDRASGEDADLITTPNLRIATRRSSADEPATLDLFSGGGGEATTRRRFLNEKEAPSASTTTTGRVLVPAMTEPADLALSEFGTNPHRLEPNGEPLVGSVMRFEWTSVEETETISSSENATSSVVIVVPANRTTIVENERANVTLVCPWNYLGTVTALCPLDNSTVVFNCNKTRDYQEITVGCGNASSRACVNWRSGSQQWVQESCVRDASRSTDEEDYCVCDVIRDSPAVDYSTTERIEAYAKSVLREFAGSGFNLRRSRVMIIFLCVFVGLSALLV